MGRKGDGSLIKSISYPKQLDEKPAPDKKSFIEEMEDIAAREGESLSSLTVKLWQKYQKEHGSGNPIYPITKWFESPMMSAIPALMENTDIWQAYLRTHDNKLLDEIIRQTKFVLYHAAAMRDLSPDKRKITGFGNHEALMSHARNWL